MRFNALISLTFFATLTLGRAIVRADGALSPCSELEAFEGAAEKLWGAIMFVTEEEAKAKRKKITEVARKNYEATSGLPDRKTTFHIPGAPAVVPYVEKPPHTYTGVDVRKAVYDSHREAARIIVEKISKTKQRNLPLKNFHNYKHELPKVQPVGDGEGRGRERPLKNMKVFPGNPNRPPGKEFPLPNKHNHDQTRGPARVIVQPTKKDRFDFKGVVSHDQSRLPNTPGYNDHFKVKAKLKNLIWD